MKKIPALFPAFILILFFFSPTTTGFCSAIPQQISPAAQQSDSLPAPLMLAQNLDNNYSDAIIWYRQLAEQGKPYGQYYLGLMYSLGKGLPQDYKKAAMWFRKAAEQGYADAQFELGRLYGVGQGVDQDIVQAYVLISLAARQGHKKAIETRGFMVTQMSPEEIQQAQELLTRLLQKSQ